KRRLACRCWRVSNGGAESAAPARRDGEPMSFVHPLLLGGLLLVGIPVLIHLIMQQKPKRLPFPAFRFLLQKHRTNQRRLRLRHWLLLALRVLLVAAICLAFARPKLFSGRLGIG